MSKRHRVASKSVRGMDPHQPPIEALSSPPRDPTSHAAFVAAMQKGLTLDPRGDLNGNLYWRHDARGLQERYWIEYGYARFIPNTTYDTLYRMLFGNARPTEKQDLFDVVPKGVQVEEGSVLVHPSGYPDVYMTDHYFGAQGGVMTLRYIPDPTTFNHFHFSWNDIQTMPVRVWMMCPKGDWFSI